MQFDVQPGISLTIPSGAGPGQSRTVIGQDIPGELIDFYLNSQYAPYSCNVISVDLFYNDANDYYYIAHLQSIEGSVQPALGFGVVASGTVIPRLFLDSNGFAEPKNISTDLIWSDPSTGDTFYGTWSTLAMSNWNNRAGYVAPKYLRLPSPYKAVWIVGTGFPTVSTNGLQIFQLDAGMRPTNTNVIPVQATASGSNQPVLEIDSNGIGRLWDYSGTGVVSFNGMITLNG